MKHTEEALARGAPSSAGWPAEWSEAKLRALHDVAAGRAEPYTPIDLLLAPQLLRCAAGDLAPAEAGIAALLRDHLDRCRADEQTFISFMFATFLVQRFDLTAALLRDRFGYGRPLEVAAADAAEGLGRVRWEVRDDGSHRFTFDRAAWRTDNTRNEILSFFWAFPLCVRYSGQPFQKTGRVVLNQQDVGGTPGIAWCDNRPDFFLVPDCIFVPSQGYAWARRVLAQNAAPWEDRAPTALWRGATTGIPASARDWRSLERVKLCEIGRRFEGTGLIDAGLSSVVQFPGDVAAEVQASGLLRGPVPWQEWGRWRWLIDVDGNSSPWSNLFQRLLTGSVVVKVESMRGLQQWFYDELVPWGNYVPAAPDMSDLMEKLSWLNRNDGAAKRIGEAGRALAERLTYGREVARGANVIASAFRYFNGRPERIGPFGCERA